MILRVGTSGFSYKEWKGSFYPEDLKPAEMLAYYSERLPAVEINNTFYRLPKADMLELWASQTPSTFRFSIKASRRITHIKRLKEPTEETAYLLDTVRVLQDRLGVVLFQLPPNLKKDVERLDAFLEALPDDIRCVFEFRHESWLDDEITDRLRAKRCALCLSDTDESQAPDLTPTADFGYLRLRRQDYDDSALGTWHERIRDAGWDEVFVFFKHEDEGTGPRLAARFLELAS